MGVVLVIKGNVAFKILGMIVIPRAADDGLEPFRIMAAQLRRG